MPSSTNRSGPRVLLVRFGAMGDLLLTTPLIRALRKRHPEANLTLVTRAQWVSLVTKNPHLTNVIAWEEGRPLKDLARDLRTTSWTHRLDLHGSLRSAALRWHVGGRWRGYPKHRIARTRLIRTKRDQYRDRRPVAERYFDAARGLDVTPDGGPADVFLDQPALRAADALLRDQGHDPSRTLIAVAPGAAHFTKQWPLHLWRDLAEILIGRGDDIVVVGGPDDLRLGRAIHDIAPGRIVDATGRCSPLESGALLKRARCAVTGDTGLMHLATAVGTPVAALFGPTVEAFGFAPYQARAEVIQRDMDCRPCTPHGGPACPLGHHRCLLDLPAEVVADVVRRLPR